MKSSIIIRFAIVASIVITLTSTLGNFVRAAEEFTLETARSAAEKGDAKAAYWLAKRYFKGDGVTRDHTKAAEFMRQAAELGHAFAQNDLGAYYAKGWGVKQDYAEAAKWYRKAAENGDSLAQYSLGRIYSEGRGVTKDTEESLRWFKKAAGQNQPDALVALGDIYLNGHQDLKPDLLQAFGWFQKAAEHGSVSALNSLGFLYEGGNGLDENGARLGPSPDRAVKCYREAAMKGDGLGEMNLGRMYLDGFGVARDLVEAYKWFLLAQRSGEPSARKYMRDLETSDLLTPEQMAEADRLADELERSLKKKA